MGETDEYVLPCFSVGCYLVTEEESFVIREGEEKLVGFIILNSIK